MNNPRYTLEPYKGPASRVRCPSCGKPREFTRYLDTETGNLLPDKVGRCNREDNCGYHYTPKQYFEENRPLVGGSNYTPRASAARKPAPAEQAVQFLSLDLVAPTMCGYGRNNFVVFLKSLFGKSMANDAIARYFIGTSKHWQGANIFWQIDTQERVRQAKVMLYNPETGKRVKSGTPAMKWGTREGEWIHDTDEGDKIFFAGKKLLSDYAANLSQCFFGEHLLAEYPGAQVGIVESEKTAVIASIYFPKLIWLATGGKCGASWTESGVCRVLANREVILFPDLNAFNAWSAKAQEVKRAVSCKIMVSDLLETIATREQRSAGLDLADFLLIRDEKQGWALSEQGYPIMWDLEKNCKIL